MPAGFESKAAFVREADIYTRTWPSAVPAVATQILPLLAENVGPEVGQAAIVTEDSDNQALFSKIVNQSGGGELVVEARYSGLEFIFAASLGFMAKRIGSVVMPEVLGGGAFRHLFEIDRVLEGQGWLPGEGWVADDSGPELIADMQKLRRGTFVVDKGVLLWETLSAMPLGLLINGNGNGFVTVQMPVAGFTTFLGSIGGNDLSALTCETERVLYTDMTMKVARLADAPLTDLDLLAEVTGFNVGLNNNLTTTTTHDTKTHPDEPSRSGPIEVRGGFAIPSYKSDNDDLSFEFQAGQELISIIEFVGPEIAASGEDFTLRIYLPSMKITGVSIEVGGPQMVQQNYEFTCYKPETTPTGFPANVKNGTMMIELINDVSTHALLD
jgi:hypothetical protein